MYFYLVQILIIIMSRFLILSVCLANFGENFGEIMRNRRIAIGLAKNSDWKNLRIFLSKIKLYVVYNVSICLKFSGTRLTLAITETAGLDYKLGKVGNMHRAPEAHSLTGAFILLSDFLRQC